MSSKPSESILIFFKESSTTSTQILVKFCTTEKSIILFKSLMAILGVPLDLFAISKAAFSSILILNLLELNKIIFFKSEGL